MARSRTLNFVLAADAKQVVKAFGQTDQAATRSEKHQAQTHQRMQSSWSGMAKGALKGAAGITAAYVSISKAHDAITATEDLAKATAGLHRNLGLSIEVASQWAAVAKARGIDNKALTMSFTTLSKNVEAATHGGKKQQEAFKLLGLSQNELKAGTHDFNGLLLETADGFGKLKGGTERQAAAQKLLGKGYATLLPLFSQGSKSLKEQLHWADQYGVTLDEKTLQPVEALTKAQRELKVANLGLKVAFTRETAPALLKVEQAGLKVLRVMNDPNLTNEERWKKLGEIVGPIADQLSKGVLAAIPKIADHVGEQAPKVAEAFVTGFLKAGVWGKLAIGAFLITKMGGWGAVLGTGRKVGQRWGLGFAEGAGPEVAAVSAGGTAAAGGAAAAGARGARGARGGVRAALGGPELAAAASAGLGIFSAERQAVRSRNVDSIAGAGLHGASFGLIPANAYSEVHKKIIGVFTGGSSQGMTLGMARFQLSTKGKLAGFLSREFELGAIKGVPAIEAKIGGALKGARAGKNADDAKQARQIGETVGALRKQKNELANNAVAYAKYRKELASVTHAQGDAGKIGDALRDSATKLRREQSRLTHLRNLAATVDALKDRMHGLDKGTQEYKDTAEVLRKKQKQLNDRMDDAYPAARKAGRGLGQVFENTRNLTGGYVQLAQTIAGNTNNILGQLGAKKIDFKIVNAGAANVGGALKKETGGWIGSPGEAGRDMVPAMLGRGEAVLNRYQQQPVEHALQSTYGMGLDDLFSSIQRPHYMASGGRAGGLHPGIAAAVKRLTAKFPLAVTSTTGGTHAPGSYHYKGEAADLAGSPALMFQAAQWIKSSGMARSLTEGIHNPNLSVKFGKGVASSYWGAKTWGDHRNHIHLALAGALGALAGGAGSLSLPHITGSGAGLTIMRAGGRKMVAAANKYIGAHSPMDTGYSALPGGGSNTQNMQLGRRMLGNDREWPALRELWQGESGWSNTARNPSSGAYGIPQALPASKMGAAANPPRSDPGAQIMWGLNYISGRYGSPSRALSAWRSRSPHWYARGGWVSASRGIHIGRPVRPSTRSPNVHSQQHHSTRHGGRGFTPVVSGPGTYIGGAMDQPDPISAGGTGTSLEFPEAPTLLDYINLNIANAGLTDTAADDIDAAGQLVQYWAAALGQATTVTAKTEAATNLASARAGLKQLQDQQDQAQQGLIDALNAAAAAQQALADEVKRQNDFNARIAAITGSEAVKAMADVISGNLGARFSNRARTPGSGRIGSLTAA